jgi:hypothetical protein
MATVCDNVDILIERRQVPKDHALSLLGEIYVERGDINDWNLLHELHYKAENLGIGPKIFRCVLRGQTIGVGVMTVPKMLLSGRNEVFSHLKPNTGGMDTRLINRHRAFWINAHACTNSRLVLDTMYRGAGIAYKMQNLMMRMTSCSVIEFQSSMSKFNPFAAKAGIRFTKPKRSANYTKGMEFFRRWFECNPSDFVGVMSEIAAMKPAVREKCVAEMRKFYYACSALEKTGNARFKGVERSETMDVGYLLKSLQQLTLASPLYGVYLNPDATGKNEKSKLPARLPILAFDYQPIDEPLDISKLPDEYKMSVNDAPND